MVVPYERLNRVEVQESERVSYNFRTEALRYEENPICSDIFVSKSLSLKIQARVNVSGLTVPECRCAQRL